MKYRILFSVSCSNVTCDFVVFKNRKYMTESKSTYLCVCMDANAHTHVHAHMYSPCMCMHTHVCAHSTHLYFLFMTFLRMESYSIKHCGNLISKTLITITLECKFKD